MIQGLRENAARPRPAVRQDAILINRGPHPLIIGDALLEPNVAEQLDDIWISNGGVKRLALVSDRGNGGVRTRYSSV